MKFFSVWQPARLEDRRTAMVFGFLRHASASLALDPWLSEVLDGATGAEPLRPADFWPRYTSHFGGEITEPDLVFDAHDSEGALQIIVEAKPERAMHDGAQLVREIVDTALGEPFQRVALIAVGADLGPPAALAAWQRAVDAELSARGMGGVTVRVLYSSWAQIGRHIARCAREEPSLAVYADDVLEQLRRNAMLGYEGAPVPDEETLTVISAVQLANRTIATARQLFITIADSDGVRALGLLPSSRMQRDGTSTALRSTEEWFELSTLMLALRDGDWPADLWAYVAVWLGDDDTPKLHVGIAACVAADLPWQYANSEDVTDLPDDDRIRPIAERARLTRLAAAGYSSWAYAEREWARAPGADHGDADVTWIYEQLATLAAAVNYTTG